MNSEDKDKLIQLVTDYMCWWDGRLQNEDFLSQLDDNATWERNIINDNVSNPINKVEGKNQIIDSNKQQGVCVHSTSNYVFQVMEDGNTRIRVYFRTYFRNGQLFAHGEDIFTAKKSNDKWKIMSVITDLYWISK